MMMTMSYSEDDTLSEVAGDDEDDSTADDAVYADDQIFKKVT